MQRRHLWALIQMSNFSPRLRALLQGHLTHRSTPKLYDHDSSYSRIDLSNTGVEYSIPYNMRTMLDVVPFCHDMSFKNCTLSDESFAILANSSKGQKLQRLKLANVMGLTVASVNALTSFTSLQHLCLWASITEREAVGIQELESLRSLKLAECKQLGDSTLQTLLHHRSGLSLRKSAFLTLTALDISDTKVSDKVFSIIGKSASASKLLTLRMNRCTFTGANAETLVKGCTLLTSLSVAGSAGVTSRFPDAFFQHLPSTLVRLNLYRARGVTEVGAGFIAKRYVVQERERASERERERARAGCARD